MPFLHSIYVVAEWKPTIDRSPPALQASTQAVRSLLQEFGTRNGWMRITTFKADREIFSATDLHMRGLLKYVIFYNFMCTHQKIENILDNFKIYLPPLS